MSNRFLLFTIILSTSYCIASGVFNIGGLNQKLSWLVPTGYEIKGYEDLQNKMFQEHPSVYSYRQCKKCGYDVVNYGKPYKIVFKPDLSIVVPNSTVFIVFTQPKETELRKLFRSITKELREHYDISYFFVLTRDRSFKNGMRLIRDEVNEHHDMLVFNHSNSYNNLVLNVLLSFHYVYNLDLPNRYFVKVDADIAINIHLLMNVLYQSHISTKKMVYLGRCSSGFFSRVKGNKHFVPESIYGKERTIRPYDKGGLYVLSKETLPYLLIGVRHLPFITQQEDVTCGRALHLMSIPCNRYSNAHWLSKNGCTRYNCSNIVAIHSVKGGEDVLENYAFFNSTKPFFHYEPKRSLYVNQTRKEIIPDYFAHPRSEMKLMDISSYRYLYP